VQDSNLLFLFAEEVTVARNAPVILLDLLLYAPANKVAPGVVFSNEVTVRTNAPGC
jgi:hypothetical protein